MHLLSMWNLNKGNWFDISELQYEKIFFLFLLLIFYQDAKLLGIKEYQEIKPVYSFATYFFGSIIEQRIAKQICFTSELELMQATFS